jgi:hypothetical protein
VRLEERDSESWLKNDSANLGKEEQEGRRPF